MISWDVRLNAPCGRMVCEPGWTRTRENSVLLNDAELWFVWKGRGWMRTRSREYTLLPGFCAIMRPGGIYDAGHDVTQPLGIVFLHFDVFRKERPVTPEFFRAWPEFFEVSDVTYWEAITRRIVQLSIQEPDTAAALLRAALADLVQSPELGTDRRTTASPSDRRISEIASRLSVETAELPSVQEMARQAGLSPSHFSRSFRRLMGQSPMDFLLRTRLTRAQHYLRETAMTVSEIAERLGYADVFFFSRQFKQKTGLCPSDYRRRR